MKLLILGGYGAFGGRLATLLADLDIDILICGRREAKAKSFCDSQTGRARYHALAFDRKDIDIALSEHTPDIVVDASGPFQAYGDDPYSVVKACVKHSVHYLDLADAADFVDGISQFDAAAKQAEITLLSGLSTCPALSGAVLKELSKDMDIKNVSIGIAPTPHAALGKSVIEAALTYAGGPIALCRNGNRCIAKGLTEYRRFTIAPPGKTPLKNRHFSLAELPDLTLYPQTYPHVDNIWGGAGIKPEWLHKILNVIAHIRAKLRLPAPTALTNISQWALKTFSRGEHRGGMYVEVKNKEITKSWHLIAEGDDGPIIPAKACEAIIRKWMAGDRPTTGARPATHELSLDDFNAVFQPHNITHGFRSGTNGASAFETVLGNAFGTLPETVQHLHRGQSGVWAGDAQVKGPANPLGHLAAFMAGIKIKSGRQPVEFTLTCDGDKEVWERNFGGNKFLSKLTPGKGRNQYLMMERFGFLSIAMALVNDGDTLRFIPRRWFAFGVPLPNFLLPKGDTFEFEQDARFHFDVKLSAPLIGRIAEYKGWLEETS